MVYVKVDANESFDAAIKRFAKELKDSGLNDELQKRKFKIKKTTQRRLEKKARALKIKIANREN